MHKIDTENRTTNNEFQDADASQGKVATDLNAAWFNTIQRELCNAVEHFGQVLNADNDGQLLKSLIRSGIKAFHHEGDEFEVTSDWNGSSIILCGANDFTIDGYFDKGSLLIVLPIWGNSTKEYITVRYGLQNAKVYKGQGFFGICMNGEDELYVSSYPFVSGGYNGKINLGVTTADSIKTKAYIDDGYIMDPPSYGDVYAPWQLASNWSIGQVKRVRSCSTISNKYSRNFYCNTLGDLSSVEFYPNSYREFMCVGTYDNGEEGNVYAVLAVNGAEQRDAAAAST